MEGKERGEEGKRVRERGDKGEREGMEEKIFASSTFALDVLA